MAGKAKSRLTDSTEKFEAALTKEENGRYVLKLYITGLTRRSQQALSNLQKVCREYLGDNYELEVIDVYQQPTLAKGEQIIAVPTLIRKLPLPVRRLIGDLSREGKLVLGLDLKAKKPAAKPNR